MTLHSANSLSSALRYAHGDCGWPKDFQLGLQGDRINLITRQPKSVLTRLLAEGEVLPYSVYRDLLGELSTLRGDPLRSALYDLDVSSALAYKWLGDYMLREKTTHQAFRHDTSAMFWAWADQTALDLVSEMGLDTSDQRQELDDVESEWLVYLWLQIPSNRALVSRHSDWTTLKGGPLMWSFMNGEDLVVTEKSKATDYSPCPEIINNLFDVHKGIYCGEMVQATVSHLGLADLVAYYDPNVPSYVEMKD